MFVVCDLRRVVVGIGHLSAHFRDASIILKLFIIFSAVLNLTHGFNRSVDSLQLNNTGGVELGLFFALGTAIKLHKLKTTNEFLGQFST